MLVVDIALRKIFLHNRTVMFSSVYKSLTVAAMQFAFACLLFMAGIYDAQAGITINGVG
jgi:hypothetical protein